MIQTLLLIPSIIAALALRPVGQERVSVEPNCFWSPGRTYRAVVEFETGNSEFVPFSRFELRRSDGTTVYTRQGGGHTLLDISDQGAVVGINFDGPVSGHATLHFYAADGTERGITDVGFLKSRAFSADGSTYAVDDGKDGVRVFRADGTEMHNLGRANRFALSGDGRFAALAQDNALVLFRDGKEAGWYPLASPFVRDMSLSQDGSVLAWVDRFRLRVLDTKDTKLAADVAAPDPALRFISASVSADGGLVAAGLDADAGRGSPDRHRRGLVMLLDQAGIVLWQESLGYDHWNFQVPGVEFSGPNSLTVRTADLVLRYEQ